MNNIYVLNPDFKLEGIIDEYVSNIWRPSYSEVGDFEIYLGATDKAIQLLQQNRYVVRSSDISVKNYTGKNLLNNNASSKTTNGVTFTVNKDGSVTANGTATNTAMLELNVTLKAGVKYFFSGCPANGSSTTYKTYMLDRTEYTYMVNDFGEGGIVEHATKTDYFYRVRVEKGCTVNNLIFYPMIQLASDATGTYEPYTGKDLATILTPNGLNGIPVESGGNYTDSTGQQWICDEIVKYADGSGERIQRVVKLNNDDFFETAFEGEGYRISSKRTDIIRYSNVLCTHMIMNNSVSQYSVAGNYTYTGESGGRMKVRFERTFSNLAECKQYMNDNGYEFYVAITEPIRTPLTAEELAAFENLMKTHTAGNFTNDANCGMVVGIESVEQTISGESIILSNATIKSFSLCGKSVQNGTPQPSSPVAITVTGSNGSVTIKKVVQGAIPTYKNVMQIKNIQLITDVENGDFLCVTGRELKYLLHQRIVWSQTNLTGTVENAIRQIVNENAINPTDINRVIPNLTLDEPVELTDTIDKQVTGDYLDKVISEICTTYNYGWDIYITDSKLMFTLCIGTDRSYAQTKIPYVVFSDKFENLNNTNYQLFTEEYANTTLIGGEGEGLERVFATVNNELVGLNRYETFTDARDISSNNGEIDAETYLKLLAERGSEKLATLSYTEGFSGEVLSDVAFKYGQDFFIGDTVTVINKYGIQKNVRVLSAIESEDENGVKLLPQFNI